MKLKKITTYSLLFLFMLSLCSCAPPASSPEDAVNKFCSAFSKKNYLIAFKYVADYDGLSFDDRSASGTKKIVDAVAETLTVEVTGSAGTENPYGVNAKITTVDVRKVYEKALETVINEIEGTILNGNTVGDKELENKLNLAVVAAIKAEGAPTVTTDAVIKLEQRDGEWKIIMDDLTVNILTGYMQEANDTFKTVLYGHDVSSEEETPDSTSSADNA